MVRNMEYYIKKINRTVILDDEIVEKFLETGEELTSEFFAYRIFLKYDCYPTKEQVPDEELSAFCNEVLLSELKMYLDFPKICAWLNKNADVFIDAVKTGKLIEMKVTDEGDAYE